MRVILISPSLTLSKTSFLYKKFSPYEPSLGIGYLAAVLEQNGIEVCVIDQNAKDMTNERFIKIIKDESPDIVGFFCVTIAMGNIFSLAEAIRSLGKNIYIILGNIHPTVFADEILKSGLVDIIVRGEGEFSLLDTVMVIEKHESFENVNGISFVNNNVVHHIPERRLIEDLDELPYPAWHLFDFKDYHGIPVIG